MLHHFKQFRKRHRSNDSAITLLNPLGSCRKAAAAEVIAPKLIVGKKDEELEETQMGGGDILLLQAGGMKISDDECLLRQYLMEPKEVDHPIRCPHPEHCIIQDGRALKLRAPSIKRRGQLPFLRNEEAQSQRWKIRPTASAPETSFKTILPGTGYPLSCLRIYE